MKIFWTDLFAGAVGSGMGRGCLSGRGKGKRGCCVTECRHGRISIEKDNGQWAIGTGQ